MKIASWFASSALIALAMGCSAGDDTSDETPAQPCQGTAYAGHCYVFVTSPMSWDAARSHCHRLGSFELVTIEGEEEEEWLHGQETARVSGTWWIGYTDEDSEGNWKWTSGSQSKYNRWSSRNPDNYTGGPSGRQNCVTDNYSDGRWDDDDCLRENPFICEK